MTGGRGVWRVAAPALLILALAGLLFDALGETSVTVDDFGNASIHEDWQKNRTAGMVLLKREAELEEIVRLVGVDALGPSDRLTMQSAKLIREDFLHQNAFDDIDTFTSLEKQFLMLDVIIEFHNHASEVLDAGVPFDRILDLEVLEQISRAKLIEEPDGEPPVEALEKLKQTVTKQIAALKGK